MSNPKENSSLSPTLKEIPGPVPHFDTVQGLRAGCFKVKDTYYFSHDYNARNDEKIKRLIRKYKMEGYGIFWAIVEDLYNNANALHTDYEGIAFDLHTDIDTVKSIINDFDLFVVEGNEFGSASVERRLTDRNDKSEKARQSAFKRWDKNKGNANAMQTHSDSNAIKEKKRKEKKENIIEFDVIVFGWSKNENQYKGLLESYPKLFQFKYSLKFEEHQKLLKKYGPEKVERVYNEMQNYKDLLKKSESAYLTATNWLNRNYK